VPDTQGAGVGEKFIEARQRPHDLRELEGELDLLLGHAGGEQLAQSRIPVEQFLIEPGRHGRQPRAEALIGRLDQGELFSAWARPARLLTPSLV
jgi:hypothetical protein